MCQHNIIHELYEVIRQRREDRTAGSYTARLFNQGEDKILKKIGEEAAEVILAAKNGHKAEIAGEAADLIYHLLVLLAWHRLEPGDVLDVLAERRLKSGASR